jgi:hypothetical protein
VRTQQFLIRLSVVPAILFIAVSSTAAAELSIDPANFVSEIDNDFFPLRPGTTFVYEGTKEGLTTSDTVEVTRQTKQILGVDCTVVHDQAFEGGILVEDTLDFYAQDVLGTVWYFGEDTKELDANGNVISTEGSWLAGVDDATPGIIMEADPKKGDKYRQEFARGVAEDVAQVTSLDESACVAYGCFSGLLLTKETTRLEPGVVEGKYYAVGVGFILGVMEKGGDERSELVRVTTHGQN